MPSDILLTPWIPTLNKEVCASYPPYDEIVNEGAEPNSIENPHWARRNLEPELEKVPDGADALWEVVLALWRLKLLEETGGLDETWRNLVSAWLHRHHNLCAQFKIAPFKVVMEYQDALRAMGYLPFDTISDLEEPVPAPEPVSMSDSEHIPGVVQSDNGDSDIEMTESAASLIATSRHQKTPAAGKPRLNLGEYTFLEDSIISTELVPALEGMVCVYCASLQTPPEPCVPIWHKRGESVTIRCNVCLIRKQGCSFKNSNWQIGTWPRLEVTDIGVARRAKEVRAKQKTRKVSSRRGKNVSAGPSKVSRKPDPTRQKVYLRDVYIRDPPPKFLPSAKETTDSGPAATSTLGGTTLSVFFQDIDPFEKLASDPNITRKTLKDKAIELRMIAVRESNDAQALLNEIQGRAETIQNLATELNNMATDEEEDDIEDGEDDGMKGTGDDGEEGDSTDDARDSSENWGDKKESEEVRKQIRELKTGGRFKTLPGNFRRTGVFDG